MVIDWMTIPTALDSILEFLNCKCKKGSDSGKCSAKEYQDSMDNDSDSNNYASASSLSDGDED